MPFPQQAPFSRIILKPNLKLKIILLTTKQKNHEYTNFNHIISKLSQPSLSIIVYQLLYCFGGIPFPAVSYELAIHTIMIYCLLI